MLRIISMKWEASLVEVNNQAIVAWSFRTRTREQAGFREHNVKVRPAPDVLLFRYIIYLQNI